MGLPDKVRLFEFAPFCARAVDGSNPAGASEAQHLPHMDFLLPLWVSFFGPATTVDEVGLASCLELFAWSVDLRLLFASLCLILVQRQSQPPLV